MSLAFNVQIVLLKKTYHGLFRLLSPASMSMTWRLWSRFASLPATTHLLSVGHLDHKHIHNRSSTIPARTTTTHNDINFVRDGHFALLSVYGLQ